MNLKNKSLTLCIIFILVTLPKCSPDPNNGLNLYYIAATSQFQDYLDEITEDYIYLKPAIDSMDGAEIFHLDYHATAYLEEGDTTDLAYCANLFQQHSPVYVYNIAAALLASTEDLYDNIPSLATLTEPQLDSLIRICQDLNYIDPEFPWSNIAPVLKDCTVDSLYICYDQCSHNKTVDKAKAIGKGILRLGGAAASAASGYEIGAIMGLYRFVSGLIHDGTEVENEYTQCRSACYAKYGH